MKTEIQKQFEAEIKDRQPEISLKYEEIFGELEVWICGGNSAGLVLRGGIGQGKTTMLRAICKIVKAFWTEERILTIRQELRNPNIKSVRADDLLHIAHTEGREGLFYGEHAIGQAGVLFIDDLGGETETEIRFEGWNKSHEVYIRETIRPFAELLTRRCDNNLPTLISTRLDKTQIIERYGESVFDRLFGSCNWVNMHFKEGGYR